MSQIELGLRSERLWPMTGLHSPMCPAVINCGWHEFLLLLSNRAGFTNLLSKGKSNSRSMSARLPNKQSIIYTREEVGLPILGCFANMC